MDCLAGVYFKEHALQVTGMCNISGGLCLAIGDVILNMPRITNTINMIPALETHTESHITSP